MHQKKKTSVIVLQDHNIQQTSTVESSVQQYKNVAILGYQLQSSTNNYLCYVTF